MKAVLLCGGYGRRLRPLTDTIPKPLVPIAGRPLLDWQLTHLAAHGLTDVMMNLFLFPEKIKDFVGDGSRWGISPTFQVEEKPLGTAGALSLFQDALTESFLVLYSDVFNQIDLGAVRQLHEEHHPAVTVVVRQTDHPEDSDLLTIDRVQRIVTLLPKPHREKSTRGMFGNVGCYIFHPAVLHFLPKKIPSDIFQDFLPHLLGRVPMRAVISHALIQDVGTEGRLGHIDAAVHDYFQNTLTR